jgi:hypothetical protein
MTNANSINVTPIESKQPALAAKFIVGAVLEGSPA